MDSNNIQTQQQGGSTALLMRQPKKKDNSGFIVSGLIALGLVIVTFLVAFLLYIPTIQEIAQIRDKQKEEQTEIKRLQDKYNEIVGMGKPNIDANLEQARQLVPDEIQLSELATFINQNASKFDLEVSRLNLNEDKVDVRREIDAETQRAITAQTGQAITLGKIEGPFGLSGTKQNIFRFLDFLVSGGFASNFDQVLITPADEEKGTWSVSFVAVHHYLLPAKDIAPESVLIKPRLDLLSPIASPSVTPTPSVSPTPTVTAP
ncbi:MAG: hypothetical protein QY314_04935 [Candidatus Dojkabacteria bacterium]|nr:MAG: hypothetical protein QY314_04935 [Candidatus Dojkabacteria bacterium]